MPAKKYQNLPSNIYEAAILATWREAYDKRESNDFIEYSKKDLVRHGKKIENLGTSTEGKAASAENVPDITYTYRVRKDLPQEILEYGDFAIVGRGKGLYAFAKIKRKNRIKLPRIDKIESIARNKFPTWVRPLMSDDEQAMLSIAYKNDLVRQFLKLKSCYRIQSHMRKFVKNYGQVEIDDLYVGRTTDGCTVAIVVEAKNDKEKECLNISQLHGISLAVQQLYPDPEIECRVIGVKPTKPSESTLRICMCEFKVCEEVKDLKEVGKWTAYEVEVK